MSGGDFSPNWGGGQNKMTFWNFENLFVNFGVIN